MQRLLTVGIVLLLLLTGCGEDVNPVIGKWRGKITEDQRNALLLPNGEEDGILVAEFTQSAAILNGRTYRVEHKRNEGTYYVNPIGTNRTMAIQFSAPGSIEMGMPHRFKAEIIVLFMTRSAITP